MDTNRDEWFIDSAMLPEKLSKEEVYSLLTKVRAGDIFAKEKLALHNIRLVLHKVQNKFKDADYDKKDLVAIGNVGLVKAINSFDMSKGHAFSTYASRCIENEILMVLRKTKKDSGVLSLEQPIYEDSTGGEIVRLKDTIKDETNIEEDYMDNELCQKVRKIVESLPPHEREIIMLRYGFYDGEKWGQCEIAKKVNTSQVQISRTLVKTLDHISKLL